MTSLKTIHVFYLAFAAYFFSAAGYVDTVDALPSIDTAFSFLQTGHLHVKEPLAVSYTHYCRNYSREPGKTFWYSRMGLTLPLLYLPPVATELAIEKFLGVRRNLHLTLISLVNPLISALLVTLLFSFFIYQGFTRRESLCLAGAAGFATLIFPYAKTCHREPLEALCLTASIIFTCRAQTSPFPTRWLVAASSFAGFGLMTKLSLVVSLLPILMWGGIVAFRRRKIMPLIAVIIPFSFAALIWGVFALYAYGPLFPAGYSETATYFGTGRNWSLPLIEGLYRYLFSLEFGLLFYEPMTLLAVAALFIRITERRLQEWEIVTWISIVVTILFHVRWNYWGEALGPRLLVILSPLLAMLFSSGFASFRTRRLPLTLTAGVLLWAFVIQTANTSVKMQQYWTMKSVSSASLSTPHWIANLKLFLHKLQGKQEIYRADDFGPNGPEVIDLSAARSLEGLNFWWLHTYRALNGEAS